MQLFPEDSSSCTFLLLQFNAGALRKKDSHQFLTPRNSLLERAGENQQLQGQPPRPGLTWEQLVSLQVSPKGNYEWL
jgi:hypothetical protein